MKSLSKQKVIIILVVIIAFVITNPSERHYLNRVAEDYGATHHGMRFDEKSLLSIGESDRTNYFLFSVYDYRFGEIRVSYLGLATQIFYMGSNTKNQERADDTLSI